MGPGSLKRKLTAAEGAEEVSVVKETSGREKRNGLWQNLLSP